MAPIPAAKIIPVFGGDNRSARRDMGAEQQEKVPVEQERHPLLTPVAEKPPGPGLDEVYARGYEAGQQEARRELEQQIEKERAEQEQKLALERVTWANRETEVMAEKIVHGFEELERRLASTLANVLRPFLQETIRRNAVAELVAALETILGADDGVTLEISGPEDLISILRDKLQKRSIAVLFKETDDPDVRVVAGQTVLETCLASWMKRVEERIE